MIFIGSRKELEFISDNFKSVWITFIREFNQSFPHKTLSASFLRKRIVSLKEKVQILLHEATRKADTFDPQLGETRRNLTSLISQLLSLQKELDEFSRDFGEGDIFYDQIRLGLAALQVMIQNCKVSIKIFAKSYLQENRRRFLIKSGKITAVSLASLLALGTGSLGALHLMFTKMARNLPLKQDGLAILISYHSTGLQDKWLATHADLFIPMYVARVELAFGQKVNIVKKAATRIDFLAMLDHPTIQNIVLFGHGSWNSWNATDGEIDSDNLRSLWEGVRIYPGNSPKMEITHPQHKRGFLVRHTCGQGQEIVFTKALNLDEKWKMISEKIKRLNQILFPNLLVEAKPEFVGTKEENFALSITLTICRAKDGKKIVGQDHLDLTVHYFAIINDKGFHTYDHAEYLFRGNLGAVKIWQEIISLFEVMRKKSIEIPIERMPLLGLPFFDRENIKGWNRNANPIDFIINVFGQEDQKRDRLFAMRDFPQKI